jgi:transcriptional regulator with XRE-family HTH domain
MKDQGQLLHIAMREKSIDQKTLAKYLGLSQASISKIINGKQYLDFNLAIKACEFLGITLDWLAYGRELEPAPEPGTGKSPYYRDPERREIEYLVSILEKTEYRAAIVALEGVIELRWEREGACPPGKRKEPREEMDIGDPKAAGE